MKTNGSGFEPFLALFVEPLPESEKGKTKVTDISAETIDEN